MANLKVSNRTEVFSARFLSFLVDKDPEPD
jgi:hypothetical protein